MPLCSFSMSMVFCCCYACCAGYWNPTSFKTWFQKSVLNLSKDYIIINYTKRILISCNFCDSLLPKSVSLSSFWPSHSTFTSLASRQPPFIQQVQTPIYWLSVSSVQLTIVCDLSISRLFRDVGRWFQARPSTANTFLSLTLAEFKVRRQSFWGTYFMEIHFGFITNHQTLSPPLSIRFQLTKLHMIRAKMCVLFGELII